MTQRLPLLMELGASKSGLQIGYAVMKLDYTVYSPFTVDGVIETDTPGTYVVLDGYAAPDEGGYVIVSESDGGDPATLTALAEAAIESSAVNVTHSAGVAVSGRLAEVTDLPSEPLDATATQAAAAAALTAYDPPTKAELDAGFLALVGADGDTLETLSDQLDGVDANVDAIKLIADDLDLSAVTQVSSSLAGHLTITRGLTFAEAVTGLTIPVDWETAYWTLKRNPVQPDTAALVRLLVTNPAGESDGLQRLKGAEPASPITEADGTLTVTQATGRIDIWLSDELTACLSAGTSLGWDVKFIDSAGDSTGRRGTADVVLTETHATA